VEEEWTIADRDVSDEVWYSTCYRRALHRNFDSDECPVSVCGENAPTKDWKFGGHCISCAAAEANAVAAAPYWVVLPADECVECAPPLFDGPVYEGEFFYVPLHFTRILLTI
jgi:hypothetical protein